MTRSPIAPCRVPLYSGTWIDTVNPDPNLITLEDVAFALRHLRWGGHRPGTHAVAAHAVLCAERAAREGLSGHVQMLALHHDDGEFLWGDVTTPQKRVLRGYRQLEKRAWRACLAAFHIIAPSRAESVAIARIDRIVAKAEDQQLRPGKPPLEAFRGYPDDLDCVVHDWTLDEAAHAYMSMHKALRGEMAP